jgi:methylated-DNA-[protein]-cysteine S-methyltransferase
LDTQNAACMFIPSSFGQHVLIWRDDPRPRLLRVILSREDEGAESILSRKFPTVVRKSHPDIESISAQIRALLRGIPVTFSLDILDLEICSGFQRRVLLAESQVPRGRVTTYGRLARRIESPGAARAVGSALANNPFPLIIPCHRCIRSDGRLGGFRGGLPMKRALLEMEGIVFDDRGRVPRRFLWPPG